MLAEFKALMPQNDLVAVSYYPFFMNDKDRLAALDWMSGQFDEFKSPTRSSKPTIRLKT